MPKTFHRALALAALFAAASAQATPYPGYYYPSGMQAGTKVRVVVGGTGMNGVYGAYVTGEGVTVTRIVQVPGFPRATGKTQVPWVVDWMYDILEGKDKTHRKLPPEACQEDSDWSECLWWPYLDELGDLEMQIVARDRFTPENYPQPTPALDKLLILDIEAAADAACGRRDIIIYDYYGASAPHSFFITEEPHVCERFFVAPSREGYRTRKLPAALHLPTELPPQTPPCYLDGQAWPGETDVYGLNLKEGQHLVCALTGRELLPYLGDAVPGFFNPELRLCDASGHRVAEADDFYYLPDPVLTYRVPADGTYRLEVCDNLYRGRSDFVYFVHCFFRDDDRPVYTPKERAFECFPAPASHEVPPAKAGRIIETGTLDAPGRVNRHYVDIREPGAWKFELFARRQGSPLDGVLRLYGPMGDVPLSATPRLAVWDDVPARLFSVVNVGDDDHPIIKTNVLFAGSVPQVECDPVGTWKFFQSGRYCVTVGDRVELGGEHYDYTLVMEPLKPSFEIYSSTSAFVGHNENAGSFQAFLVRKNGFTGPILFDSTDEWDVVGEFDDESKVETTVTVSPKKGPWKGVKTAQLTATGVMPDGEKLTVRVTPCDSVEQAFAYTHFLPQAAFFFCYPDDREILAEEAHPLPHLGLGEGSANAAGSSAAAKPVVKKKTTHSNGQACTKCHDKKRKHTHGKACNACHKNKE